MRNDLYDESTEPMTRIIVDRRNMVSFEDADVSGQNRSKGTDKKKPDQKERDREQNIDDSIGSRIFNPNEGST